MKRDIKQLISQMTLEEKASLCSGLNFWNTKGIELSTEQLLKVFNDAIKLNLSSDFIILVSEELNRRSHHEPLSKNA